MLVLNFKSFPTLTTDRLVIRQIAKYDLNDLLYLRTTEECMKYIDIARAKSVKDVKLLLDKIQLGLKTNTAIAWGISFKDKNELIGTISFHRIEREHYRAEIGYMLKPAYWKMGITSEALAATIKYGFEQMKLHSIEANVNPNNIASIKLLEKFGFCKEAYFKENYFFEGKFLDSVIYSFINKA